MNDFDLAASDLLADPHLAEPCTYQPPLDTQLPGMPAALRAVISAADVESELFLIGALTRRYRALVRMGDVGSLGAGIRRVEGADLGGGVGRWR